MIEIRIALDDQGGFSLAGVPENVFLALGLLEMAKFAIAQRVQLAQRLVQPATIVPPSRLS